MANYNKSFNFRNGVQVDNDNFIVNENGLVGIGTTIPKDYLLNVYGDARVVGILSATEIKTQIFNLSGISSFTTINIGITSITSGIITATSGVVTYYGDGSKLSNLPTSQWVDANPGAGFSRIYAVGNVGIATTNPAFSLQVGANPLVYSSGIGINSTGDVYSNGIVTATSFSGSGVNLSALNASNITSGTLSTSFFPSSIRLSGIITASSFVGSGAGLTAISADNITSGTLSNSRLPSNISVGVITATTFEGNLTGTATTATTLTSGGTVSVGSVNSGFTSTGIATVTQALYVVGFPAKVGVGTTSEPEADIEVNKLGISSIRVISRNNIATIGIGRSAEVRTGNTNTFYLYSTPTSLDIINSTAGNVNYYLDYGTAGLGTGAFHWIYGQNPSSPVMSLTYNGNLGLGITNPTSKLYVVGTSYITGITTIDSNLTVSNNLSVGGNITFNGSLTGNLGITTLSRLGISTSTISSNSYEFFVGGDPVFGNGVYITAGGDIRSSNQIIANHLSSSGVSTLGNVQIYSGIITASAGNVTYYGDGSNLISLTGASPSTYGSPITIPQITVDSNGRITSISNVNVSGGIGGGSGLDLYRGGVLNYVGFASAINFSTDFAFTALNTQTGITTVSILSVGYALVSGFSTYSALAGISTYSALAGISTYSEFSGISTYSDFSGISTYAALAGVSTYSDFSGISTYAGLAGVSTSVIGGIGSITQLQVTGISTFNNGPVFIGAATSTGTAAQRLQVTGGAYVSGSVGIGTTVPRGALDIVSTTQPFYLPRMTTSQRNLMSNVSVGAMIYNLDSGEFEGYGTTGWITLGA